MGRPKALLPWGGRALVEWQVEQLKLAGCGRVIVVTGHRASEIEPLARSAGAEVVLNAAYRSGRASSLRTGADAVEEAGAVVVLNVDQPRPAWVTRRLVDAWRLRKAPVVVPDHGGRLGHPVLLDGSLLPDLRSVREETLGLREIIERMRAETEPVAFDNRVVIVDLNTPEDYENALAEFYRGAWEET